MKAVRKYTQHFCKKQIFLPYKKVWMRTPTLYGQNQTENVHVKPANCLLRQSGEKRVLLLSSNVFNYLSYYITNNEVVSNELFNELNYIKINYSLQDLFLISIYERLVKFT